MQQNPHWLPKHAAQPLVELSLLGVFRITGAGGARLIVSSKKNRALLAYLALSPNRTATRERIAGLLWGEHGEDQARNSLRQSLAVLRKELGQDGAGVLLARDDTVALAQTGLSVDVDEFAALAASDDARQAMRAVELWRGVLIDDVSIRGEAFEEWLSAERDRLKSMAIGLFDRLVPVAPESERIEIARRLIALDPLREASHRQLMRAYAGLGERALALKHYDALRKTLRDELAVEPAEETQRLRRTIADESVAPPASVIPPERPSGSFKTEGRSSVPSFPSPI